MIVERDNYMKNLVKSSNGLCFKVAAALVLMLSALIRPVLAGDLSDWKPLPEGGATVEQVAATPQNDPRHQNYWRLTVKTAGLQAGMMSEEIEDADLRSSRWCDFTFKARTEGRTTFALTFSLVSLDGKKVCARATIPEVGGQWADYNLALRLRQSEPKYRLVIALADAGSIWLGGIAFSVRQDARNLPRWENARVASVPAGFKRHSFQFNFRDSAPLQNMRP
jgi:hypothetical protein